MILNKNGMTLVEILVSMAILSGICVVFLGYLFHNPISQKAYTEDYGRKLSNNALLEIWAHKSIKDSLIEHRDSVGVSWTTNLYISRYDKEICVKAISVRSATDTTKSLLYCFYE